MSTEQTNNAPKAKRHTVTDSTEHKAVPASRVELSRWSAKYPAHQHLPYSVHIYIQDELISFEDLPTYAIAYDLASSLPLPLVDYVVHDVLTNFISPHKPTHQKLNNKTKKQNDL